MAGDACGSGFEGRLVHVFECDTEGCDTCFAVEAEAGDDVECPVCTNVDVKFAGRAVLMAERDGRRG